MNPVITNPRHNGPEILKLHESGLTVPTIARALNLTASNVYDHLKRRGIEPNRKT